MFFTAQLLEFSFYLFKAQNVLASVSKRTPKSIAGNNSTISISGQSMIKHVYGLAQSNVRSLTGCQVKWLHNMLFGQRAKISLPPFIQI